MGYKKPERTGHYDREERCYIWKINNPKFHRKTQVLDGVRGTLLPYVDSDPFLRPGEVGPRGGRAYLECYRQIWWAGGRFCVVKNVCLVKPSPLTKGEYVRRFVPADGITVFNRYDNDDETYTLVGGMPTIAAAAGIDENGNPY